MSKSTLTRRILNGSVEALPIAGAALVFLEVLAISRAYQDTTTAGWAFIALLSLFFGVIAFAFPIRMSLSWRFVSGSTTALLVASGILFLFGIILAIMGWE